MSNSFILLKIPVVPTSPPGGTCRSVTHGNVTPSRPFNLICIFLLGGPVHFSFQFIPRRTKSESDAAATSISRRLGQLDFHLKRHLHSMMSRHRFPPPSSLLSRGTRPINKFTTPRQRTTSVP